MLYTSYYRGEIIGKGVSISIHPPAGWDGEHMKLFAPTKELLDWWKRSPQDKNAEIEYERQFREMLANKDHLIKLWVSRYEKNPTDITLLCYEGEGKFCHRHQVGEEIIKQYLPDHWGGELGKKKPNLDSRTVENPLSGQLPPPNLDSKTDESTPNLDSSYQKGDRLQYFYPRDKRWWDGQFIGFHCPNANHPEMWTFIEVQVGDRVLKAFSLDQIRKEQVATVSKAIATPTPKPVIQEIETSLKRLPSVEGDKLEQLQDWCKSIAGKMIPSISSYANGRKELHLRHFVKIAKKREDSTCRPVDHSLYPGYEIVEKIGERLLPGFHQALVLYYPSGTLIKTHRDSSAYISGAAQINVIGNAVFCLSGNQDSAKMQSYPLIPGDCISFDNKQPHGIQEVIGDRWCICFFNLYESVLNQAQVQQLTLSLGG